MEEVEGEEQMEEEEEGGMEEVEVEEQVVEEEKEEDKAKDGVDGRKRRDLVLWLAMAVTRFQKTFIYRIKLYRNVPVLNMACPCCENKTQCA